MINESSASLFAFPTKWTFTAFARKLLFAELDRLPSSSLLIHEPDGNIWSFGKPEIHKSDITAEIFIHDPACYQTMLTRGSIGAAEAYIDGQWTSPDLTKVVQVMVRNMDILDNIETGIAKLTKPIQKFAHALNRNSETGSRRNIAAHYDLGNDLFRLFLDSRMMYSSAIFPHSDSSLEEASEYKLTKLCERLNLNENDHLLEIGTGWGGFAVFAAQRYGCRVTTTTISEEQYQVAQSKIIEAGLSDKITLLNQDYRQLDGEFDKIVSIEMIEAVGWQYYETFFDVCNRLLKPNGLLVLQAITIRDDRFEKAKNDVDFIQSHIFPGSNIPSVTALSQACTSQSSLRLIAQEDYAEHYARTLKIWAAQFNQSLQTVLNLGYDQAFVRMWNFYLAYCEGGFLERSIGLSHLVWEKPKSSQAIA